MTDGPGRRPGTGDPQAEAVLAACRILVAVAARSISAVEEEADLLQVRALVVIASRGPVSLGELAQAAGLHLTRASRLCDRMVQAGLITRAVDPANRRQVILSLTFAGQQVVETVMQRRWAAIEPVLARMTEKQRRDLVAALAAFAEAAEEVSERDLWAMGWTT